MLALNNLIVSTVLRIFALFTVINMQSNFIQGMISLRTKFHIYNFKDSLALHITPKAKKDFRKAAIFLSYIL